MTGLTELFKQHNKIFVTGTDTEVGKTYCSCLMLDALNEQGIEAFPFKPISAGTEYDKNFGRQVNEDAKDLYQASNAKYRLEQINPIVFESAIAPHIAAKQVGAELNFAMLDRAFDKVDELGEVQLIEGAGGWLLPLNDEQLLSDWVAHHKLPVIMVVSIKLGCLNHALLTAQAIKNSGCELIGWIANFNQGETEIGRENLSFIKQKLVAPLLFEVRKDQTNLG